MAKQRRWLTFVLVLASSGLAAEQRAEQRPRPDLSGAWSLNRELSTLAPSPAETDGDSPKSRGGGRDGRGRGDSGGGMPGGMPGGGAPGGGPPSGMPSPEEFERMQRLIGELLRAQPRLIIKQEAEEIRFTEADGHVRTLNTTGKKQKTQLVSATVETKLKWNSDRLEQEFTVPRGRVVYRFTSVSADQLAIDVDPPSTPMGSLPKVRWVYDRVH